MTYDRQHTTILQTRHILKECFKSIHLLMLENPMTKCELLQKLINTIILLAKTLHLTEDENAVAAPYSDRALLYRSVF